MTGSDWITITGVVVTLISMAISIRQAGNALKSSAVAKNAMVAVQMSTVAERLKSTQEHIRDISPYRKARGLDLPKLINVIQREFDYALSALPRTGPGGVIRTQLANAQSQLNLYQTSLTSTPDTSSWQKLQTHVQEVISDLTTISSATGA